MKLTAFMFSVVTLTVSLSCDVANAANSVFTHFISARDGQLFDGAQPFRFLSFDIPNLLLIEDNVAFGVKNPWRLPDRFEINDALGSLAQMGGTVTRTYVISVQRPDDPPGTPRHVLAPGKFNETAFRTLDQVLATANQTGVRLIIPLVDNWPWMGGRAEYAGFRGKTKDNFWTDPQLIADFEQTIRFILTRTNTITGIRYADDPAVLCWETGNELDSPVSWTREIAHYIKSLDTNHLVMDGFNTAYLRDESLEIPDVDIVTTHHYPGGGPFSEAIRANAGKARGKKPYIVGEFGFVSTEKMADTMKTIMDSGISGGLIWSLRFRDRDGGFYWHTESGSGGNYYKSFHWPPSPLGNDYDEINLMTLARNNAFAIRGLTPPPVPVPAPPHLLPVTNVAAIAWQGSIGATSYQVERAAKRDGPWRVVAPHVDEAFAQYRPQFADEVAAAGKWYYRVRAENDAGISGPSNVAGPVKVKNATLVDELADFSKTLQKQGNWKIATHDCRATREDAHRAAGVAGDVLIYQLPSSIRGFRVFAFFPKEAGDIKFSVSQDGQNFQDVAVRRETYPRGSDDYDYLQPVEFEARKTGGGTFLRIELTGEAQIGRVEISHKAFAQ
jgi:mannan endo-1,4-beta-mannosidase